MASDVDRLLSHLGLEDFPYHEFFRERRGELAASRWALLAETDRTLRAVHAERARVVRLLEAEGADAAARRAEQAIVRPRRLSLLGSVRRFSSERRSH